jgi:hypothetical protein
MTGQDLQGMLDAAAVDGAVLALRPDYRVMLVAVSGIEPGQGDDASEALLQEAEVHARDALAARAVTEIPHVAAWRDAFKAFGTKPQRFRNSLEALLRRAEGGLPRINRLTDIYNAISVMHQVPLGGEDLDRYDGPPRLSAQPATSRSTPRRTARKWSSIRSRVRSSGATTPVSPAAAGTGARLAALRLRTTRPPPSSSSTPSPR